MWSTILRTTLLLQFIYIVSVVAAFPECSPGATWKDDCNTCFCTSDGQIHCTWNSCGLKKFGKDHFSREKEIYKRDVSKCTPGTTWKDDCNTCFCTPDGHAGCTLMACPPKHHAEQQRDKRDAKCTPGATWKQDCNTCRCSNDGQHSLCTRKYCIQEDQSHPRFKRSKYAARCKPGTNWREDCNSCLCSDEGYARCTQMICPSYMQEFGFRVRRSTPQIANRCTPGTTWMEDCNRCFCSANGFPGCTYKACISHNNLEGARYEREVTNDNQQLNMVEQSEPNCQLGEFVAVECNLCYCLATGLICTKHLCHGPQVAVYVEH